MRSPLSTFFQMSVLHSTNIAILLDLAHHAGNKHVCCQGPSSFQARSPVQSYAGKLAEKEIRLRLDKNLISHKENGWQYVRAASESNFNFEQGESLALSPLYSIQWQRSRTGCAASCTPEDFEDMPYVVVVLTVSPCSQQYVTHAFISQQ